MVETFVAAIEGGSAPREPVLVEGTCERARWELDTSGVRPLVEAMTSGRSPSPHWVDAVLAAARVTKVNPQVEARVGSYVGQDAMRGRPVAAFWPAESRSDLAALIVQAAGQPSQTFRHVRGIASLLLDNARLILWRTPDLGPDRLIVEVEGVARDGRSNLALRASEERYRRLIHHLPIALLQVDGRAMAPTHDRLRAEGVEDFAAYLEAHPEVVALARERVRITEVNRSAEALVDGENLIGPIGPLFAASPGALARILAARFEGHRNHSEMMKLRTRAGRVLDVRLTVTFPAPPEQADVTLVSLEDLTDRIRTEAQLRQIQADFSRAARISTLGELTTSIAHEVNQPLAAILTNAETSLRWLSRDEPDLGKVRQLTTRVAASARRASEIVNRIRSMVARRVPERSLLDLNEVVYESLLFVRHDLETRSIALSLNLGTCLPRVLCDRVQLQQVIVNLLVNGIQAMAQGSASGGSLDLATGALGDGTVSFAIRDRGPGIAPGDMSRLFEGFFTTKEEGMGIGLAICQSIVAAHGGTIDASNHPEGGALFLFSLPAATAA